MIIKEWICFPLMRFFPLAQAWSKAIHVRSFELELEEEEKLIEQKGFTHTGFLEKKMVPLFIILIQKLK